MLATIRSIWAWAAVISLILIWAPIMFVVRLFDRKEPHYRTGRWFRRLGSAMVAANPIWRVTVSGTLPENPRNPYVVVGNHQSNADIPVYSRLPWDMKWVGKKSVFKLPILGWMMRISRDIPVDRGDRRSRASVFIEARKRLEQRVSVMIFPEGTRSRDGRVGAFTDGAFAIAIKTGVPILPVAMDGTFNALPKKSWRFGPPVTIRLHVFEPVPTADLEHDDVPELRDRIRQQLIGCIADWRGTTPAQVDKLAKT